MPTEPARSCPEGPPRSSRAGAEGTNTTELARRGVGRLQASVDVAAIEVPPPSRTSTRYAGVPVSAVGKRIKGVADLPSSADAELAKACREH